ncbi:MAG: histidinol-phosphate aminotransferase family protein [Ruminococcaceae bacterium]|nr:histidinol-phosphate aminotransferase family protein [Oscillospiraceae bacterium]
MYQLNDKIKELTPYEPLKGDFKIRLDANESYLHIPDYILEMLLASSTLLKTNRYPDPLAIELCTSFANAYGVSPSLVAAGNGSDELIQVIFSSFLMKGEKYASFDNDFSMYDFYGHISECECVKLHKRSDLTIDVDEAIKTCNENDVKLLIFSNPCNPTSLGLVREDVRKIINNVKALVILDEAYMDFWDQSILSEIESYDNLIILRTCSKAYGLAALRVGFAVANKTLINVIKAVKSPYNVNSISQHMASVILSHKGESHAAITQIKNSTKELYAALTEFNEEFNCGWEIFPTCTNFVTVRFEKARELYNYLLSIGIAIRCFGPYLRITAGSNNENIQLIKFIEKYYQEVLNK